MTSEIIANSDMQVFSPADIKRAGELLRCPMDEASAIKALIIQRDTGLSLTRGEISIVPFNGRPTVMINKQGYLAYAARQPNYDGYESGIETVDGETVAWCVVYDKNVSHPVKVRIFEKEYAKQTPIWKEKPRYMLEKTAISLALRAAFPILNGTYEDGEIEPDLQPVKIQQQPTDINVDAVPVEQPKEQPKPEPVKTPEKHTCKIYTVDEINTKLIPIYQQQKLNLAIFSEADLGDGTFNRDLIDADYKKQITLPPSQMPAPTKEASSLDEFKAEVIQEATKMSEQPLCTDCKKVRVFPDEAFDSNAKYGVPLCKDCMSKRIANDLKAKNEAKPSEPKTSAPKQTKPSKTDENVCSVCGKKMTKAEVTKFQMFNKGKALVCADCASKSTEN